MSPSDTVARGLTLRVATFNVLFGHRDAGVGSWRHRRPLIERSIESARPDILALQEVFPSKLADMGEAVRDLEFIAGPASGPPRWGDVSVYGEQLLRMARTLRLPSAAEFKGPASERMVSGEHQPIAYRASRLRPLASGAFWISATPERAGSLLPFAPTPFLVHWARFASHDCFGSLLVCNAHFGHAPWHHGPTARIVARQIETIASQDVDTALPETDRPIILLLGDFNAWPSSPLVRRLTSAAGTGFVDAARAATERVGPGVTFHWGLGSSRFGFTLDYVLSHGRIQPRRAEVIDVHDGRLYPSDHYPLVIEFESIRN